MKVSGDAQYRRIFKLRSRADPPDLRKGLISYLNYGR